MKKIRTFIAIKLPDHIISHIHKIQQDIKSYGFKASWVRAQGIHLTLKFLGDIPMDAIEPVGQAMTEAVKGFVPLSLAAKGLGVFPNIKRPRVVWLGLNGDTHSLIELQKSIDGELEKINFPKENRPFKGHLTLARIKQQIDSSKLLDAMKDLGNFETEPFVADQIILFKSDLKPTGAVYTPLFRAKLAH